ncbi:hypothetical protein CCACVL1_09278 [Corchorus capsularis]|uniref:Uncharacterized protein n=1 Tax=Corchorus capsularis TaxID=210143 RepID=A0A1R3IWW0_COCAP|nr:hypothetical protein CCACVL1_09278 [Corchorus capsularis]
MEEIVGEMAGEAGKKRKRDGNRWLLQQNTKFPHQISGIRKQLSLEPNSTVESSSIYV